MSNREGFKQYDRSKIEDTKRLNDYRDRVFEDKRSTKDAYTGKTIYRSANGETKGRSDPKHYTPSRIAQTDHTVPLEHAYKGWQGRLSDEELREVLNQDYNFEITNGHLNMSKKGMTNHQYVMTHKEELDLKTAATLELKGARAQTIFTAKAEALVVKKAATQGAETALITLIVSGSNNLTAVARGDKSVQEAAQDVVRDAAGSFLSSSGTYMVKDAIHAVANNFQNETLKHIATSEIPVAELALIANVSIQMRDYLNGRISAEDCAVNILLNGAGTFAYQLGMLTGCAAGPIVATIVVTQIANMIVEYRQAKKIAKEREAEVNAVLREAMSEIVYQRNQLKTYLNEDLNRWDETIDSGFAMIFSSALDQDSIGITDGLNMILALFDQQVLFPTTESFIQALDSDKPIVM